jgi:hypothetical protein
VLTSESLGAIAPALAKAQAKLEHASKDRNNPHFKSKYADLPGVVDTIKPVLAANDLAIVQGFVPSEQGVTIETRIVHKSGEWIQDEGLFVPADRNNAQGFGSACTYGRRYALMALVGVAPDDDDDGNAASAPAKKTPARKTAKAQPEPEAPSMCSDEQQAELVKAAVAAGIDANLAKRTAANTLAKDFVAKLAKLKEQANA